MTNMGHGTMVQVWERGLQYKSMIGIGYYKCSLKFYTVEEGNKWVKVFEITSGKCKGDIFTELECDWNLLEKE